MSGRNQNPIKAALCGLVAGAGASAAMDVYWKIVRNVAGDRPEQKPKGKKDGQAEGKPSTQIIADKISEVLTGKEVPRKDKAIAGIAVHYATGLICGAFFGIAAAARPRLGIVGGLLYGAAIWALLDEAALRMLDIAPDVEKVPTTQHIQALGAHLVYGSSTALLTRMFMKILGGS